MQRCAASYQTLFDFLYLVADLIRIGSSDVALTQQTPI